MPKSLQVVIASFLLVSATFLSAAPCSAEKPAVADRQPLITHHHFTFAHTAGGRLAEVATVNEYGSDLWRSTYAVKTAEENHLLVTETTQLQNGSVQSHTRFTDAESGYWVEFVEDVPVPVTQLSEVTPELFQAVSPRDGSGRVQTAKQEAVRRGADMPEAELQHPFDRPLTAVLKGDPPPASWLASVDFLVTAVCPLARRQLSESLCQKADVFGRTLVKEDSSPSDRATSWALTGHQYGSGTPAETSATVRLLQEFNVVLDSDQGHMIDPSG